MIKSYITISISIVLIIIFLLYHLKLISIPTDHTILNVMYSNVFHLNFYHLVSNLIILYSLIQIEEQLGVKSFLSLLTFLIIVNTFTEYIYRFFNNQISIGFSGILYGLIAWEIYTNKNVTLELVFAIILRIGTTYKSGESIVAHIIGALSGIGTAILWKYINTS